jgi:hypothetical protein
MGSSSSSNSPFAQRSYPKGPMAPSSGPVSSSGDMAYTPIRDITPYQNKWVLKARLVQKQPIRTYKSARGEGRLLNITFCDSHGDEIRATSFNAAIDKWDPMLEVGKVGSDIHLEHFEYLWNADIFSRIHSFLRSICCRACKSRRPTLNIQRACRTS